MRDGRRGRLLFVVGLGGCSVGYGGDGEDAGGGPEPPELGVLDHHPQRQSRGVLGRRNGALHEGIHREPILAVNLLPPDFKRGKVIGQVAVLVVLVGHHLAGALDDHEVVVVHVDLALEVALAFDDLLGCDREDVGSDLIQRLVVHVGDVVLRELVHRERIHVHVEHVVEVVFAHDQILERGLRTEGAHDLLHAAGGVVDIVGLAEVPDWIAVVVELLHVDGFGVDVVVSQQLAEHALLGGEDVNDVLDLGGAGVGQALDGGGGGRDRGGSLGRSAQHEDIRIRRRRGRLGGRGLGREREGQSQAGDQCEPSGGFRHVGVPLRSFYFTRGGTIIPFKQQLPPLGGLEVRKPCLWLTPALMLALATGAFAGDHATYIRPIEMTLPAAGVTQVVLINLVGPVTVETAPDAAIHLEVLVHAGGSDAAFARTLAGQLDFQTQQTGGQLRISGVYPLDHFRDYGYPNMKSILGIHGTDSNEYNGQKVFIRDVGSDKAVELWAV